MVSRPNVYIAGVGCSPASSNTTDAEQLAASQISAATKALLDAGITADDVDRGVLSDAPAGIDVLGFLDSGIPVERVSRGSEIGASLASVRDRGARCVLTVATEGSTSVGLILIDESFIWSRRYLYDTSMLVDESEHSATPVPNKLAGLCQRVWALRGWSRGQSNTAVANGDMGLTRADKKEVPKWEVVEHRQDGKHRLGYNPALQTRDVSHEDVEAVRGHGMTGSFKTRFARRGGDRAALARL